MGKNSIEFQLTNKSKVPNNYVFNQSTYVTHNWETLFHNEKISTLPPMLRHNGGNAGSFYLY
jgi:hypothetical protein